MEEKYKTCKHSTGRGGRADRIRPPDLSEAVNDKGHLMQQ